MQKYLHKKTAFLLAVIILLGIFLRISNISPFKFYPDAYQSLLVSGNITNYHSVVGYLGTNGMLFPEFFMWTRPLYPLLIALFSLILKDPVFSAQTISFLGSVIAIPLSYVMTKAIFRSPALGILGALLVSLSFSLVVWSGFIMTEATGVFCMMAFLVSLFTSLSKKPAPANIHDLLTGFLLTLAIFARYEYAIILLPLLLLLLKQSQYPAWRIINILAVFLLTSLLVVTQLFPIASVVTIIFTQLHDLLLRGGEIAAVFIVCALTLTFFPRHYRVIVTKILYKLTIGLLWITALYLILQRFLLPNSGLFWKELSSIRNFTSHDILLSIFSLIGFTLLLKNEKYRQVGIFALLSAVSLGLIYNRINPEMDRYMTHLIPFLLIPATYGLSRTIRKGNAYQFPFILLLIPLFFIQGLLSYNGIKNWSDKSWFRISYEERAAKMMRRYIRSKNPILIVSFPEPYYFYTKATTQSVTDTYPFIYIDDSLNSSPAVIVSDMGMKDLFPHFATFLEKHISDRITTHFQIGERYHFANRSEIETSPTTVYETTIGELKKRIKNSPH
ncbi:MAG: glycosyltransferase family 39 protein [bacterium]|nr:glycosyltransferase family 39 protein [bacterium]